MSGYTDRQKELRRKYGLDTGGSAAASTGKRTASGGSETYTDRQKELRKKYGLDKEQSDDETAGVNAVNQWFDDAYHSIGRMNRYNSQMQSKPKATYGAAEAMEMQDILDRADEVRGYLERYGHLYENADTLNAQLEVQLGGIQDYLKYIEEMQNTPPVRDATFKDITAGSFNRGFYNSRLGEETFKELMGVEGSEADTYREILAGDEYRFEPNGWLETAVSGAAELGGQLLRQATNPRSLTAAATGAGGAWVLGKAGPQALLPEEVITMPAAALAGMKAGSAVSNLEIEAGHAYNEMMELGIDADTAKAVALAVGGVNAAIEGLQLDKLENAYKALSKSGASDSVLKRIGKELMDRGVDVGKETAQEVAQESVTVAGAQAANKLDKGEWAYDVGEVGQRLKDTAVSSALTFGLMNVPAGGVHTAQILGDAAMERVIGKTEGVNGPSGATVPTEGTAGAAEAGAPVSGVPTGAEMSGDSAGLSEKDKDIYRRSPEFIHQTEDTEADTDSVGQTLRTGGEAVTIERVSYAGGGRMIYTTSDGQRVSADEVVHATADEAAVHTTVRELAADHKTANAMIDGFKGSGMKAETYTKGLRLAEMYGRNGIPEADLQKTDSAAKLPAAVRAAAYKAGKLNGGRATAQAQAAVNRSAVLGTPARGVPTDGTAEAGATGVLFMDGGGNFMDLRTAMSESGWVLSDTQEAGVLAAETIHKALGVDIRFYESYRKGGELMYINERGEEETAPNGFYERGGAVYIDLNAGADGKGTVAYTLGHELTHYIATWSPAKFKVLANTVVKHVSKDGRSVEDLIAAQMVKAERSGQQLTEDEALEEVVADAMEAVLADGNVLRSVLNDVQRQDRSLWERITQWLKQACEKLTQALSAYKELKPDSEEGRMMLQMQESLRELEQIYAEGLTDAARAEQKATKNTRENGSAKRSAGAERRSFRSPARYEDIRRAKQMEREDETDEAIRRETGLFRGDDGMWRQEMDDSQMVLAEELKDRMLLGELIEHWELFDAYPDMERMVVRFSPMKKGKLGQYSRVYDMITLNKSLMSDREALQDTLLHEIQHAIQAREGFAGGASVEYWEGRLAEGFDSRRSDAIAEEQRYRTEYERIASEEPKYFMDMMALEEMTPNVPRGKFDIRTLEKLEEDPPEWQRFDERRDALEAQYGEEKVWDFMDLMYHLKRAETLGVRDAYTLYYETAGEIEARDVEARRTMTQAQRKANRPKVGRKDVVFAEKGQRWSSERDVESASQAEKNTADGGVRYSKRYMDAEVNQELLNMVEKVAAGEFSAKERVHLGTVSDDVASAINSLTGVEVRGFEIVIEARQIEHILKDHGHRGLSDTSMSDPASIAKIGYALNEPDEIRYGGKTRAYVSRRNGKNTPSETVLYEKSIGEKSYYVIQAVPETKKKTLYVVTAFIGKSGYKKEATQSTDTNSPSATPKAESALASDTSISDKRRNSNRNRKEIHRDREYMDAVNRGDMETAQRMVDEAAMQWGAYLNKAEVNEVFKQDGEVRVFYHGTNNGDFNSFDNRLIGSSSGDLGWFGKGFYFAFSYGEAATYGGRVIPAYLKMSNPFDYSQLFEFKGSAKGASKYSRYAWLYNVTKKFPDIVKGQRVWAYPNDGEEGVSVSWEQLVNFMDRIQREEQFFVDEVELSDGDTAYRLRAVPKKESYTNEDGETFEWTEYGMSQLFATEEAAKEPINQIGAYLQNVLGIDSIPRRTIEKIDFSGAVQRAGYDGILQSMSGDEAVVFSPEQIKSADPVTYDDNGNVIPLSKRFNAENPDIRYSKRNQPDRKTAAALERENERLREDVKRLKELVKLQRETTDGKILERGSVEKTARLLMRNNGAKGDARELADLLQIGYGYIRNGESEGLNWEDVREQLAPAARWLAEHIPEDNTLDERAAEILGVLKSSKVAFSEEQKREAAIAYDGWGRYRNSIIGAIGVSDSANTSLDQLWKELSSSYPTVFDETASDTEQVHLLPQIIEELRGSRSQMRWFDTALIEQDLVNEVYDGYWRVSTLKTAGDKYQKQINELKSKHAQQMQKAKDKLKETKLKQAEEYQEALKRLRKEDERLREERSKQYAADRRAAVNKRKATMRKKHIRKTAGELERMLNRGTKEKNVKEGMREFVERAIQAANAIFQTEDDLDILRYGVGVEMSPKEQRHYDRARELLEEIDSFWSTEEEYDRYDEVRRIQNGLNDKLSQLTDTASREAAARRRLGMDLPEGFGPADLLKGELQARITNREAQIIHAASMQLKELYKIQPQEYDAYLRVKKLESQLRYRVKQLQEVFQRHRQKMDKVTAKTVIRELATGYRTLEGATDHLSGAFDKTVFDYLNTLAEDIGDTPVHDMSGYQLERIDEAFTMVLTTVRNVNEAFTDEKKRTIQELGEAAMKELEKQKQLPEYGGKLGDGIRAFDWNNLKPVYAFERLGSETMQGLHDAILRGQDTYARDFEESQKVWQTAAKKYGLKDWDMTEAREFEDSDGKKFLLTLDQMMSLCAYARREQAHEHLLQGGIVLDEGTKLTVKGKLRPIHPTTANTFRIDEGTMQSILKTMTPEQRSFAMEMQDYLSGPMAEKGNEVSMKMYGVKLFKEQHYFPLHSAKQYNRKAKEQQEQGQVGARKLKNNGMTKAVTPGANNPIVLSNFTDTWSGHVDEMSMYHAMVLPLEDFGRVYGYNTPASEGGSAVEAAIQNAHGKAATGYMSRLVNDLNGSVRGDPTEQPIAQLTAKWKKAQVLASMSVVFQQPTSIARAFALISPKHFRPNEFFTFRKNHKTVWEEVKRYAPVAIIKEMGYFDTNMGQSAKEFLTSVEYEGFWENFAAFFKDEKHRDEVFSWLPAMADEMTWCTLWNAVKREQLRADPKADTSSEEFLNKCGRRFTEIVNRTQVYDSVLSRSANMRSKSTAMQAATAFMGEPTTVANMVESAVLQLQRGDGKGCARTLGAVFTSVVLVNLAASLVYAARDDDEEETFSEKYWSRVLEGTLEGLNPMTYIPFVKDFWSAVQGYSVERADMALLGDLVGAARELVTLWREDTEDMDEEELEERFQGILAAGGDIVNYGTALVGLPLKNIARDVKAVWNAVSTIYRDVTERDTTPLSLKDAMLPILPFVDEKTAEDKLYHATVQGDEAYIKRLEEHFGTEKKVNKALQNGLRENDPRITVAAVAWNDGNMSAYQTIAKEILGEKHFSQDNVVLAIRSEADALLPETEKKEKETKHEGLFNMDMFGKLIVKGSHTALQVVQRDIIQTHVKNGESTKEAEEKFASDAASVIKKLYLDGDISEDKAFNALSTYGNAEDVEGTVNKWTYEKVYGHSYSSRDEAFIDGDISAQQLRSALVKYGSLKPEEAEAEVEAYEWMKRNPQYDLELGQVKSYLGEIEELGISVEEAGVAADVYASFREQASKCKGTDDNDDGKADPYTVQDQVFAVIDSLPISDYQKDVLFCSYGKWKKKSLRRAPWH